MPVPNFSDQQATGPGNNEVRLETAYEMPDVYRIATRIVDPAGKGLETHWQKTSQALLAGVILHALYRRRAGLMAGSFYGAVSTREVRDLLANPVRNIGELWDEMLACDHFDIPCTAGVGKDGRTHVNVAKAARDMKDRPEEESGCVLSTAKSYLSVYDDPIVARYA
jgi:type IV secretion system protein VirD4